MASKKSDKASAAAPEGAQDPAVTKQQQKARMSENSARQAETLAESDETPSGKEDFGIPRRSARALGAESEGDAGPRPEVKGQTAVSSSRDSLDEKMLTAADVTEGEAGEDETPAPLMAPRSKKSLHSSNFGEKTGKSTGDHPYPRTATDTTVAGPAEDVYGRDAEGTDREANHGANEANFGRALAKRHDGGAGQDVNPYGMAALNEEEDAGLHGGHAHSSLSGPASERYMTARRLARTSQSQSPVVGEGAADNAMAVLREMQDAILVGRVQGNDWWVHRFELIANQIEGTAEVDEEVEDESGAPVKTGRTISKKTAKARSTQTVKQAESAAKKDQKAAEKAVEDAEDKLEAAEGREDKAAARKELKDAKEALKTTKSEGKKAIREAEKNAK